MITLFLSLLMVYILLYQIKGEKIKKALNNETDWIASTTQSLTISVNSWDDSTILDPENELVTLENKTGGNPVDSTATMNPTPTTTTWTQTPAPTLANIHMLSGTKLYYGKIDSIEKLGIKYQYALIDSTWTFFINLWTQNYDFEAIARALNGNLYKITTEQELIKNKLFGSKVIYINIPTYKDKMVLMLIYINKEVRLIQISYKAYHQSKSYLKSLFID